MGGLALKAYDVKRLEGDEYHLASKKALMVLNSVLAAADLDFRATLIPSCRNKTSHGDVDIVLSNEVLDTMSIKKLVDAMGEQMGGVSLDYKLNDYVLSIAAPHPNGGLHQLDLLFIKPEAVDFAISFLSWNDVSTMLLRVVAQMNLSIGPNGLSYIAREERAEPKRFVLTRDFRKAMEFLKLDYDRWLLGFDSLEDVYAFIAACPTCTFSTFDPEIMQASVRKRFVKRPGYLGFVEWLEKNPIKHKSFSWKEYLDGQKAMLWEAFPEFKVEYMQHLDELERQRQIASAFNGRLVIEITNLKGKELGEFIVAFKDSFGSREAFENYILSTPQSEIMKTIRSMMDAKNCN